MKKIVFYLLLSLLAFSCEKSDGPAGKSRIVIRTEDNTRVISGSQIRSYNLATRELAWRSDDAFGYEDFKRGGSLVFELDGQELFRVRIVSPLMSYVEYGLVLSHDGDGVFLLGYGYPDWAAEQEEGRLEAEKNAANWNRFIECLKAEKRLK